jgi:hypothetical protein
MYSPVSEIHPHRSSANKHINMPQFADVMQLLGGQTFGTTVIPEGDLSGKTITVTGGTTGLGFECAKNL